jgi:hypothetical protein
MNSKAFQIVALLAVMVVGAGIAKADAVGGPREAVYTLPAFGTDQFEPIKFRGGELAMVVVDGDGFTNLDLYVYDEKGILVAVDEGLSDFCVATWIPTKTQKYTIVVRNRGADFNVYIMETN